MAGKTSAKKFATTATIMTALSFLFVGCEIIDRRLKADYFLQNIRQIRQGEKEFFRSHGRYGTLEELTQAELISDKLRDGVDQGYTFNLRVGGDSFSVNADPVPDSSGLVRDNHFFMDETGVIRASNESNEPANEHSDAIKNQ